MNEAILKAAALKNKRDIMPPYDLFVELDGYETICSLCDLFGGSQLYVPKKRTIFARCLENEIIREFNGVNYKTLVRKYGFSERHIRNLIKQALS